MAYAVSQTGSWRSVDAGMSLAADEMLSETLPTPSTERRNAEMLANMESAIESWLDAVARERNYSRLSISGYVTSPNLLWAAEAKAFVTWRDLEMWPKCFDILAACQAGERKIPSAEELVAELPKIVWPEKDA